MDVKKECPICRTAITTHMRSIVLDSYIDKMVEQLSDELQARRQSLVEERKSKISLILVELAVLSWLQYVGHHRGDQ